jgi:hypothetical protein
VLSNRFIRLLFVALLFSAHASVVWAEKMHEEADQIALEIASWLDPGQALVLDIRCGEWTPALSQSLRQILLERLFDLREIRSQDLLSLYETNPEAVDLSKYGIDSAVMVNVELNLKWQMLEHKKFLSYRTERVPVQSFVVKQIQLPEHRLLRIDNYDLVQKGTKDSSLSAPRLQWFEPLIVSSAVASIIFLLWTIE